MNEGSPRAQFRSKLREFIDDHPDMERQYLARAFVATLTENDRPFVNDYLAVDAETAVSELIRVTWSNTRNGIFASLDLPNTTSEAEPMSKEPDGTTRKSVYERISEWREYVPNQGDRLVIEMTRPELMSAADYREKSLHAQLWRIEADRRLAKKLPNDSDRLGQHVTAEEIAETIQTARKEIFSGNLRIAIKPVRPLPRPARIPRQANGRRTA